jgi:hypothetical protein
MQAVGGVKGSQALSFNDLKDITEYLITTYPSRAETEGWEELLPGALPLRLTPNKSGGGGINFRDTIPQKGQGGDGAPTQFVYEAADCRLFYTREMLADVSLMWKTAADAMWGSVGCVR